MTTCPARWHNTGHAVSSIIPIYLNSCGVLRYLVESGEKKKIVLTKHYQVTDILIQGKTPFEEVFTESSIFTHVRFSPLLAQTRSHVAGQDFLKWASQQLP